MQVNDLYAATVLVGVITQHLFCLLIIKWRNEASLRQEMMIVGAMLLAVINPALANLFGLMEIISKAFGMILAIGSFPLLVALCLSVAVLNERRRN
jgi:hypothetical protein